jgi:hypothetical protein
VDCLYQRCERRPKRSLCWILMQFRVQTLVCFRISSLNSELKLHQYPFLECGGNPDVSGDTALDRLQFRLQAGSSLIDQGRLKAKLRTKAPSPLRSAGALQNRTLDLGATHKRLLRQIPSSPREFAQVVPDAACAHNQKAESCVPTCDIQPRFS